MRFNRKPLVLLWIGIALEAVAFYLQGFVYSSGMREWFDALFHYPTYLAWDMVIVALVPIIGFALIFLSAIWLTRIQTTSRGEVNMKRIIVPLIILGCVLFLIGFYIQTLDFGSTGRAVSFIGAVILILTVPVFVWRSSWWYEHGIRKRGTSPDA